MNSKLSSRVDCLLMERAKEIFDLKDKLGKFGERREETLKEEIEVEGRI